MKTIVILRDRPSTPMEYAIDHYVLRWEAAGYRVINHIGIVDVPDADILIVHIDLTVIPQEYVDIIAKFPLVINGKILNISKRLFSHLLLSKTDTYTGPVIVKTNANYGGNPENDKLNQRDQFNRVLISDKIPKKLLNRLRIIRSFLQKFPITTLIFQFIKGVWYRRPMQKWDKFKTMNPLFYPIFKDINSVPNGVWKNTNLIVERYINNCKDELFYVYCCVFFGDKEITQRLESPNPIVKYSNSVSVEQIQVPDEVMQWQKDLKIDFGRFDYLEFEGRYFLIDINKTEGGGADICYEYQGEIDYLASGLKFCLKRESKKS